MKRIFSPSNCWFKDVYCQEPEENCNHGCQLFCNMKRLVDNSGLPYKLKTANKLQCPEQDEEAYLQLNEIKKNIVDFVENGNNLYIYSNNVGNGKTTWASKLMMAYFACIADNGHTISEVHGKFIDTVEFLKLGTDFTQSEGYYKLYRQLCEADLVIFDDVAVYEVTLPEAKALYTVVNKRISNGLSTIFTSNRDVESLTNVVGGRIASRIWEASTTIELKASSMRGLEL